MLIIGVDTGGTFTDFAIYDNGKIKTQKIPSNPKNPEKPIIEGLKNFINRKFILIHGTTVTTNAFLEKKFAKTAFLCTKGFEHIINIGRQNRTNLFSLNVKKHPSIVPVSLCFGINERTDSEGRILKKVKEKEIIDLANKLKKKKIKSIGLLLLHSYKQPKNEEKVSKILKDYDFYFSCSSNILAEYREYERAIVTVLNAALMPILDKYLHGLNLSLKGNKLYIIQSNGGLLSIEQIRKEPVRTMLSGPSGGVIAAKEIAEKKDIKNIITLDMGGTSTDVSVIKNGKISLSKQAMLENLPIRVPMIDIETVGAGGGSIARIDRAGVLRVGPESAGANPGPACYGKSFFPTVTDAFTVIGAIRPEYFLGGKMKIFPERSFEAIGDIAEKIGKSVYNTAEGIIRIAVSSIERALRAITVEKGEDPRLFTLMPFGGAGGLVAFLLADRLGINKIIAPDYQGVFSAFGMLFSNYRKEFIKSILKHFSRNLIKEIDKEFYELEKQAIKILDEEDLKEENRQINKYIEMRYKGQSYELTVPYSKKFLIDFHKKHNQLYSYNLSDEDCEIVNLRLVALGKSLSDKIKLKAPKSSKRIRKQEKEVFFNGKKQKFNFYKREELVKGMKIKTPLVITSEHASIMINENFKAEIDEYSNIIIERI